MMDPKQVVVFSDQVQLKKLLVHFSTEKFELFVRLLDEVCSQTGYGSVDIVISEGRIQNIKIVKSFK